GQDRLCGWRPGRGRWSNWSQRQGEGERYSHCFRSTMKDLPKSSFATSRPVAVLMVFFAAIVFGYFSYSRLSLRLMPEMSYPTITVRTEYAGAAPQEVEKDISRPVEEALGVIGGLRRTRSVSRAGVSDV